MAEIFQPNNKLTIFCGPCVIESLEQLQRIAAGLEFLHKCDDCELYFKASFDKANRTSLELSLIHI